MRKVRIGTVAFLVDEEPHTFESNLERALTYVGEAADRGCDIVCLPESFNATNTTHEDDANAGIETIPGTVSDRLSDCAARLKLHIAANFPVRDKSSVYNQTTFFDRKGDIAGTYRKVQPTAPEHTHYGITPGDSLPVIDLDFGKVASMICMDIYFPEIVRIYALKGAEIIFWPTVSHGPTQYNLETQLCARAMDYSIYIVESNLCSTPPYAPYAGKWHPGRARIVDYDGRIIADTGHRPGIAVAEIDLDAPRMARWVVGIRDPDVVKEDLVRLARLDLYARELADLDKGRDRIY